MAFAAHSRKPYSYYGEATVKKSIREVNTLPRDRYMGWQTRLNEVKAADVPAMKELACHHFSRALDQKMYGVRRALENQASFAKTSKRDLKVAGKWQSSNAIGNVFGSWLVMDRLDPGIAAIRKLAGGVLPPELESIIQCIWRTLDRVETVRRRYFSTHPATQRHFVDLSDEIWPLCDELETAIRAFYARAKCLYGLDDLNARAQ